MAFPRVTVNKYLQLRGEGGLRVGTPELFRIMGKDVLSHEESGKLRGHLRPGNVDKSLGVCTKGK